MFLELLRPAGSCFSAFAGLGGLSGSKVGFVETTMDFEDLILDETILARLGIMVVTFGGDGLVEAGSGDCKQGGSSRNVISWMMELLL